MGKRPKILCVDDQAANLQVRALMLQQFGCDTVCAHNHDSAMRAVAENKVDLLVIDYHLADGETGDMIAREARQLRPDVRLIMLTGDAKVPEEVGDSVDAVIIKGASNPTDLLDMIERLLPECTLRPRHPMLVKEPKRKAL